ncbi:hypothetical protein N5C70_27360 [Pseudomonas juntendi]|uniref:Uncharacterized protein n=1 Tax=Pseudomonas juntendi TaxID=2666183 RepID=A0ABD4YPE8_9PSED|nr:hypothetical protein [Pseudomonas juntendi]MDH0760383.1 hypothetical protein [Pseudomonas juntendi]MDH1917838.1 hypothetical protein [Pseudomonas juntendi]
MHKPGLDATSGVDRSMVYRVLGVICVALGFFCIGPMVIDQQLVNIALNMSPEKTSVMILSATGVVLFQRGIAGFIVLMLGFLIAGAACERYYALDAVTTMAVIGFPFLMLGVGVLIFHPDP